MVSGEKPFDRTDTDVTVRARTARGAVLGVPRSAIINEIVSVNELHVEERNQPYVQYGANFEPTRMGPQKSGQRIWDHHQNLDVTLFLSRMVAPHEEQCYKQESMNHVQGININIHLQVQLTPKT